MAVPLPSSPSPPPAVLWGREQIAAYLGIDHGTVKHLIERRAIPVFKVGRRVCARPATLERWLAEQEALADA